MKQLLLLTLLSVLAAGVFAQTDTVKMKIAPSARQQAITTKENVPIRSNTNPALIKGTLPGMELAITAFQVTKLPDVNINGEMRHKLQIDCTVRNGGTIEIPVPKVALQGQISYSAQYDIGIDACGASLGSLAYESLKPGESRSTTYYCTIKYDATQHAYYNLKLTAVGFTENNLQNNSAQTTIPY